MRYDAKLIAPYGDTPEAATTRLEREITAFEGTFERLEPHWTTPLRAGGWCPAQIVEHVIKVNTATSKLLYVMDKGMDKGLPLNLPRTPGVVVDGRPQAPAAFEPGAPQAYADLARKWQASRERFLKTVTGLRHWHGVSAYHPFFGDLEALGWVRAMAFHHAHHRAQLEFTTFT